MNPGLQVGPYGYTTTRMIYEQISGDISPLQIYMMQPYVHTHSYIIGTNPRPLSRTISLSMQATCDEVNEKVQLRIERKKAKKALKLVMNIYTFAIHKFPK